METGTELEATTSPAPEADEIAPQPPPTSTALVVTTGKGALIKTGSTALTRTSVTELIIAHRATIKPGAVLKLAQEFSLTEPDVDMLIHARAEFSASPAKMRGLLEQGFTMTQVHALYEAREHINSQLAVDGGTVTIAKLLLVRNTFPGAECDAEVMAEIVLQIFEAARKVRPDASLESAINFVCANANRWGAAMLETTLDIIRQRGTGDYE